MLQIREAPAYFGEQLLIFQYILSPVLWSSSTPNSHSHHRQFKRLFSRTGRCETWLWPSALRRLNDFTWTSRHGRTYNWDRSSKGGCRGRAAHFPISPTPRPLLHGEQVEKRWSAWGKDTGKKTAWQKLEGLAVSGGSDPGYRIRAKKYRFDLIRRRTSTTAIQRWNELSPACSFLPGGWGA